MVISIIALLIGILLPALGGARSVARSAVCSSNLSSAGRAMATYAADFNDWLPGPNTSGVELTRIGGNPSYDGQTKPLQNMDWVSPAMGEGLGLPADPKDRLVAMFNHKFRCPENSVKYRRGEVFGELDPQTPTEGISFSSYSATLGFHVWKERGGDDRAQGITSYDMSPMRNVKYPSNYRPRLSEVGPGESNIFALDGARYVNNESNVTFNTSPFQNDGGNWMTFGPARVANHSGEPWRLTTSQPVEVRPEYRKFAYRHPNATLNAVYFDGHSENHDLNETVNPDKNAMDLFFPPGVDHGAFFGVTR